jgi:integrase
MIRVMRRREKGDGYLARKARADGRWRASYVGSDGKRHYLHGWSKADAKAKLDAALRDKADGLFVAGPSQTVAEFLTAWLPHKTDLAPRTIERYRGLLRLHIAPAIGDVRVRKLMPQQIADFYLERGQLLSPSTIGQIHAILHGGLAQAVRWHVISRNPADAVHAPRPTRREMRFLDTPQVRTMLAAAEGDSLEALYVAAVFTGLRLGELLGLRWRDLDLEGRALTVRNTLTRQDGQWILRQPKTVHSRRTIRLAPVVADTLRAHYIAEAERLLALGHRLQPDTLVFSDRWGDPVNPWHVTERAWKPLLRRAGLPEIRFHDIRHTFASMMLSEGARVDVVSKMLGHASPAITLSIYAHLMPGDEEAAVARLQTRIGGG